jgi:hypothetical protein
VRLFLGKPAQEMAGQRCDLLAAGHHE